MIISLDLTQKTNYYYGKETRSVYGFAQNTNII